MKTLLKLSIIIISFGLLSFGIQQKLNVTSTAFNNNGMISAKYSCEGAELSPPLTVTDMPSGTKSLAIIVHDPDAPKPGGVTHWVAWNLRADGDIPENYKGGQQGLNSDQKNGYKGMCPPSGTHHYHFKLYALNAMLNLNAATDKTALENAMQGHILAQGELIGLYSKGN